MKAEPPVYILDSYALLAYLGGETAAGRMEELLRQAEAGACRLLLPSVNLGEIAYIVERERGLEGAQRALAAIQQLPIEELPADRERVLAAAHVKANFPLSYADAFVVAAALEQEAAVVTGDPEIGRLAEVVAVEMLE